MNALPFVNSKDIRAHLEKIGYEFSPNETAWLIYHCRTLTLPERLKAWFALAEEFPDASCDFSEHHTRLADFLTDYVCKTRRILREFCAGGVYSFSVLSSDPRWRDYTKTSWFLTWYEAQRSFGFFRNFSSFAKCLRAVREFHAGVAEYEEIEAEHYYVYRRPSDEEDNPVPVALVVNGNGRILRLTEDHTGDSRWDFDWNIMEFDPFEEVVFRFPTPFRAGDLVWAPHAFSPKTYGGDPEPMVRTDEEEEGDPVCYRIGNDGELYELYRETVEYSTNFERYPIEVEPLQRRTRALLPLAAYLRGELRLNEFLCVYRRILAESTAEEQRWRVKWEA